jgi:hypothetical protein
MVVELALPVGAVSGGADVRQAAQAALDQASQQILVLGALLTEQEVFLERLLGLFQVASVTIAGTGREITGRSLTERLPHS